MRRVVTLSLSISIATVVVGGGIFWWYKTQKYAKESVPPPIEITQLIESHESKPLEMDSTKETLTSELPPELNLKMTFYAQAPFGDWDYPWQEACEEASILLVANEYRDKQWSREEFKDEILKLVDWENENLGDYKHTSMQQTREILEKYLNLKTELHHSPSYDDVRRILAKGHLIIMPLAGRKLGNPFYTNGGPIYHVIVVKGYKTGEKIITHDVGTKRGEDYVYTWKTILNALHDYEEPIENGERVIIEVIPPSEGLS